MTSECDSAGVDQRPGLRLLDLAVRMSVAGAVSFFAALGAFALGARVLGAVLLALMVAFGVTGFILALIDYRRSKARQRARMAAQSAGHSRVD